MTDVQSLSQPRTQQFLIGQDPGLFRDVRLQDLWDVIAHVRRIEQPPTAVIYGLLENFGSASYAFQIEGSTDNGVTDAFGTHAAGTVTLSGQPTIGTPATGVITMTGQPLDTETVTIDDGVTSLVFEFDNNASITGDVTVTIGLDVDATRTALADAITASALLLTAVENGNDIELTHQRQGTTGNETITEAATNVTVTGLASGTNGDRVTISDGSTAVVFEFVGPTYPSFAPASDVPLQGSTLLSAAKLAELVQANPFNVSARYMQLAAASGRVYLTNDAVGTAGNVAITETEAGAVIALTGMAGGTALDLVTFQVAGSGVTSVTVEPGALVEFQVETLLTTPEFLRFLATPGETARGRVTLNYQFGDLQLFRRENPSL